MMNTKEILTELQKLGKDSIKKVLLNHGAREPFYGVKVEDLKKIQKKIKVDYQLALELYDTGVSDAMYLAGLIADDARMTKKDLQHWVEKAYWYMLSEYTVPWVASGNAAGHEMALKWINSGKENVAAAGWATYSCLISRISNDKLDLKEIAGMMNTIAKEIHFAPNRVRHQMNMFIISAGGYIPSLSDTAVKLAEKIGKVSVNMGNTACKVPWAPEYIDKMKKRGSLEKKKKMVKC
jgi:3-methyladenine DNA glycosylase AlkD